MMKETKKTRSSRHIRTDGPMNNVLHSTFQALKLMSRNGEMKIYN